MANHKSAEKSIRKDKKRRARNIARQSQVRTAIKKTETAIESKDAAAAQTALRQMQKELLRAVSKRVLKLGTASRKLSRLNARVKALAAK